MLLFMKIRYLVRSTRQFDFRDLHLNTKSLDSATRALVELLAEDKSTQSRWEMLKYKKLFSEGELEAYGDIRSFDKFATVGPLEYIEDENGKELSQNEISSIVTGNPDAIMIPSGTKQHELDYMLAEKKPLPLSDIKMTDDELRLIGNFVHDLTELQSSALIKDGPGSLQILGQSPLERAEYTDCRIETAVSDDEIRSFVAIFRRLYMQDEPANLVRSVGIFVKVVGDHRCSNWAKGALDEYQLHILSVPIDRAYVLPDTCTFSTKLLLDVFFILSIFISRVQRYNNSF